MLTDIEAIKMAEGLKNYCDGRDCEECVFGRVGQCCIDTEGSPCYWVLPSRWSKRDVDLAKALKAFGVTNVRRVSRVSAWEDDEKMGPLPKDAFSAVEYDETIKIDEIIKDGAHE